MGNDVGGRKLRTKTGCLTCRSRRKKCDETLPACNNCTSSLRRCQWPTSEELIDRRHATHRSRQSSSPNPSDASPSTTDEAESPISSSTSTALKKYSPEDLTKLCFLSEATTHRTLSRDLEAVILRHFVRNYYALLILPNCNPEFFWGWITDIQKLLVQYKSLQYSVLACGASHLHYIDASSSMQELALTYYSNSLKGLSELLGGVSEFENDNGLLTSVILLYLHGCMGRGTYTDIPRHVNAAMRILRLRLLRHPRNISRPFDRLAVESVLYQIFLVTTESWSKPIPLDYHFDAEFWLQAERLLTQSTLFPHRSIGFNSPVLGIPLALFRIVLSVKQLYENPWQYNQESLQQLRSELEEWEGAVLSDQALDHPADDEPQVCRHEYYTDAGYLYILVSSMLMDQVSTGDWASNVPRAAPADSWQLKRAVQIIRRRHDDDDWARCFIGNWPIYSVGVFTSAPEDIELIRGELHRRWDLVRFSQISRFRKDLESIWESRGHNVDLTPWSDSLPAVPSQHVGWVDILV